MGLTNRLRGKIEEDKSNTRYLRDPYDSFDPLIQLERSLSRGYFSDEHVREAVLSRDPNLLGVAGDKAVELCKSAVQLDSRKYMMKAASKLYSAIPGGPSDEQLENLADCSLIIAELIAREILFSTPPKDTRLHGF